MRKPLFVLVVAIMGVAQPAQAEIITWFATGSIQSKYDPYGYWPGLGSGTRYSLEVSFESTAPPQVLAPGCNAYSLTASAMSLGSYRYSYPSGGHAMTNGYLPVYGCSGDFVLAHEGLVQFWWGGIGWTSSDPNAWRLQGFMAAGYFDLFAKDGTLPSTPTINNPPYSDFALFVLQTCAYSSCPHFVATPPLFQRIPSQAAPIPEPATMTLFGGGLALLAARRRARRRERRL